MEEHNVISQIAKDLDCENITFKSGDVSTDIDVIISYENFKVLKMTKNFILMTNRMECDRHVFYLYLFKGRFYTVDFNIDGLSRPGYFKVSMGSINTNIVKKNGIKFLNNDFYERYRTIKREKKRKLRFLPDYLKYNLFRYQKLNLKKIRIALVGLDGAGKTTAANDIAEHVSVETCVQYMGWKEFKNPLMVFFRVKYGNKKRPPRQLSTEVKDVSLLQISMYYLELYTRHFLLFLKRNSPLVVYDRYFYDWLILVKNSTLRRFFTRIIPVPDLIVFLTGPEGVLYSRKKEVAIEKLKFIKNRYRDFLADFDNILIIDTVHDSREQVVRKIFNKLCEVVNE